MIDSDGGVYREDRRTKQRIRTIMHEGYRSDAMSWEKLHETVYRRTYASQSFPPMYSDARQAWIRVPAECEGFPREGSREASSWVSASVERQRDKGVSSVRYGGLRFHRESVSISKSGKI